MLAAFFTGGVFLAPGAVGYGFGNFVVPFVGATLAGTEVEVADDEGGTLAAAAAAGAEVAGATSDFGVAAAGLVFLGPSEGGTLAGAAAGGSVAVGVGVVVIGAVGLVAAGGPWGDYLAANGGAASASLVVAVLVIGLLDTVFLVLLCFERFVIFGGFPSSLRRVRPDGVGIIIRKSIGCHAGKHQTDRDQTGHHSFESHTDSPFVVSVFAKCSLRLTFRNASFCLSTTPRPVSRR